MYVRKSTSRERENALTLQGALMPSCQLAFQLWHPSRTGCHYHGVHIEYLEERSMIKTLRQRVQYDEVNGTSFRSMYVFLPLSFSLLSPLHSSLQVLPTTSVLTTYDIIYSLILYLLP